MVNPRFSRIVACGLVILASGCATPGSGARSGLELFAKDIYGSVSWTLGLPVKAVMPMVVRRVVKSYIDDLVVPDDVKKRLLERIDRDEFTDSTVPFLYQLSQLYSAKRETETFEQHIRTTCADLRTTPGFEHSLFHWEPEAKKVGTEAPAPIPAADREKARAMVMGGVVRIFDALFLEPGADPLRTSEKRSPEAIRRASTIVRDLLKDIAAQLPEERNMKSSLAKLADNNETIEALTISMGDLIGDLSYRSYQRYVTLEQRKKALKEWMHGELAKEDFGSLEAYLKQTAERRYAVLICVDGLQGHLVRALAAGGHDDASSRFLKEAWKEVSAYEAAQPEGQLKKARAQHLGFLEAASKSGIRDERYLPFFRSLFASGANGIATCGISTTPTISVRNIPVVLTGAPVAGSKSTGLPNFHFLDRSRDRAWYFYGNDALQLDALTRRSGMKNLFARLPHLLSMSTSSLYDDGSLISLDPYITVAVGGKHRDWGETLLESQLEQRVANEIKLRDLRTRLLDVLGARRDTASVRFMSRAAHYRRAEQLIDEISELEDQGMPQYLQYYNPWPDHFAHPYGPLSDEILSATGELNRLDFWLSRLDKLYRDVGVKDRTLFAIAGDHGLASVGRLLSVEEAVFATLEKEGVKLRVKKLSVDEGEPPVVTHAWHPPSMRGYDTVISATAGGNCTLDFFVDQKDEWARQPVVSDLLALRTIEGKTVDIVEELRKRLGDALDYLAVRDAPCGVGAATVRVVATRGGKRVDALVTRHGERIHYDFAGDLLEVEAWSPFTREPTEAENSRRNALLSRAHAARREDEATWLTEIEWQELCSFCPRPDSVPQMARLYDTDLAGTVNLFPAHGIAFNSLVPGRHAGESFHEKDAFVGFWGGGMRRKTPLSTAVNGSLAPTVYEYLTGEKISSGADGWGFPAVGLEQ